MRDFQFCPMCGHAYETQHIESRLSYHCTHCDFTLFDNLHATASALILNQDNSQLLLVKRAFEPQKGMWDIPGGFCEPTEHPEQAVHREVKEELGATITVRQLWNIYAPVEYEYKGRLGANCDIFYEAELTSDTITPMDDVADYQWFDVNSLPSPDEMAFISGKKAVQEIERKYGTTRTGDAANPHHGTSSTTTS